MARPRKILDVEKIKKLAEHQWNDEQIAAFFGVGRHTIQRRYATEIEAARHVGRANLLEILFNRLQTPFGTDTLLKYAIDRFLGPVPTILEHTGKDGGPIQTQNENIDEINIRLTRIAQTISRRQSDPGN